ncbi:DUF1524 domain-containing protein [Luteococcus sp.]|uniref:GmrSD restriction endonuclease domain-containing protein n=1 Tax=Luteococcus sp. TaxID=1969402 RepID=UPI0037362BB7
MATRVQLATWAIALTACGPVTSSSQGHIPPVVLASQQQIDQARALIDQLPVKGRSAATGYSPNLFLPGGRWPSTGHGCTVRDQLLRRDGFDLTMSAKRPCHPVAGKIHDPYSGQVIDLSDAEAEHVVARKDAFTTGAAPDTFTPTKQWPTVEAMQQAIGRDPDNLLMVAGRLNSKKQESNIASWEPPNKAYRCTYAVKIVLVKARYGLWTVPAENARLRQRLNSCPAPAK